jgi:hypothetical protein
MDFARMMDGYVLWDLDKSLCAYDHPWASETPLLRFSCLMKILFLQQDHHVLEMPQKNVEAAVTASGHEG